MTVDQVVALLALIANQQVTIQNLTKHVQQLEAMLARFEEEAAKTDEAAEAEEAVE